MSQLFGSLGPEKFPPGRAAVLKQNSRRVAEALSVRIQEFAGTR